MPFPRLTVYVLLLCSAAAQMSPTRVADSFSQPLSPPDCSGETKALQAGAASFHALRVNATTCFSIQLSNNSGQISFGTLEIAADGPENVLVWVRDGEKEWLVPGDKAPKGGRRPHIVTQGDWQHHKFDGLSTELNVTLTVAVFVAESEANLAGSSLGIKLKPTFLAPHCQFQHAKRNSLTPILPDQPLCQAIVVHSDAPFSASLPARAALAVDHSSAGLLVAVRRVIDEKEGLYSKWSRLSPDHNNPLLYGVPVHVGLDNHFQFVVLAKAAAQARFTVQGLLECHPSSLLKDRAYGASYLSITLEDPPTECFQIAIPGVHAPGNYIEAKLTVSPSDQDSFRVFARYEASRPWNQIFLGSGATVLKDNKVEARYEVPVPQALTDRESKGEQVKASIMVVGKQNMMFDAVFSEPSLDCQDEYTDQLHGFLPRCPKTGCKVYPTLEKAKEECSKEPSCHGITRKGKDEFETRVGSWPLTSTSREVSWVRHPTAELGSLITGNTVSVSRPLCFLVNLGDSARAVNGQLTVAVQGEDADVVQFYRAYTKDAKGEWQQMSALPEESPLTRSFSAASTSSKLVPVALVSATLASTSAVLTFDLREAHMTAPEAEMVDKCTAEHKVAMSGQDMITQKNLSLALQQASCVVLTLPPNHQLFTSLRLVVTSQHPLPKLVVKSKEVTEASDISGASHKTKIMHGFLQVLKMIRERINREVHHRWGSSNTKTFWAALPTAGSSPTVQYFNYDLPSGHADVEFMLAMHSSAVTVAQPGAPEIGATSNVKLQFELIAPDCSFQERVPLGRRLLGRVLSAPHSQTTACYILALNPQNLQHSDQIFAKLSPASAREHLDIFVQPSGSKERGDRLPTPQVTGDVATYSYCAARGQDMSVANSCQRILTDAKAVVLRVAVVAKPGREPVPFSLKFQNFGPSCKFPRSADLTGDSEYDMEMGPDNHVCYEVKLAAQPPPRVHPNRLPAAVQNLVSKKSLTGFRSGTFRLHIEPKDLSAKEQLSNLRVYERKPGSDAWRELDREQKPKAPGPDQSVTYMGDFGLSPQALGAYQRTMDSVAKDKAVMYAKTFVEAMGKPTFLSISVDSPNVVRYRVWFEEVTEREEEQAASSKNSLKWIIGGILVACALVISVIIQCINRSPESYQAINEQSVAMQKFNTLQDEDEDILAGKFDDIEIAAFDDQEEYEVDDVDHQLDDYNIADDTPTETEVPEERIQSC